MPAWKEAERDDDGFPHTDENEEMTLKERTKYLLNEITALHNRVSSIEKSLERLLSD